MRRALVVVLMLTLLPAARAVAAEGGPTLSAVTDKLLTLVREDGRWTPKEGWWVKGVPSGEEVKTEIVDSAGKVVAWVSWSTRQKGSWGKASSISKRWPSDDYEKLFTFTPGAYTLKVKVADSLLWETPFTVNSVMRGDKDFFAVSGPWKDVAYCYTGRGSKGVVMEWWTEGPTDLSWHDPSTTERRFNVRADIRRDGKVILEESDDANEIFYIRPGEASKMQKSVSFEREVKEKLLSADGEYEMTAYVNLKADKWVPVAKMKFLVKNGEIATNPKFSGDGIEATRRYLTSGAWYDENQVKTVLPPF